MIETLVFSYECVKPGQTIAQEWDSEDEANCAMSVVPRVAKRLGWSGHRVKVVRKSIFVKRT